MRTEKKPLSLYIHIPFCIRKCRYCDFLSFPADQDKRELYLECLSQEIGRKAQDLTGYEVQTVFVGGGTPSLLSVSEMERILGTVTDNYSMAQEREITVEANPGTVSPAKLSGYVRMGVNRLSLGLQSADDAELAMLGRIHTYGDFLTTYEAARRAGFSNINVDLMSALPGQTVQSYRDTLSRVLSLNPPPEHISAYSLILEEGTWFYEHRPELPDEETDRLMYQMTCAVLKEKGYQRYEISNYARPGFECRHNKVYWTRGDYAGFGLGAASLIGETRYSNSASFDAYVKTCGENVENVEMLSREDQMEEFMFLGLRLTRGISCMDFERAFGRSFWEIYGRTAQKLLGQGVLLCEKSAEDERIFLSEYGLDVSNAVMAEFLL